MAVFLFFKDSGVSHLGVLKVGNFFEYMSVQHAVLLSHQFHSNVCFSYSFNVMDF